MLASFVKTRAKLTFIDIFNIPHSVLFIPILSNKTMSALRIYLSNTKEFWVPFRIFIFCINDLQAASESLRPDRPRCWQLVGGPP